MLVVIEQLAPRSSKWIKAHYQKEWIVYCLNEEDKEHLGFVDDCRSLDLSPHYHALTERALELLESELGQTSEIARKLSSIVNLDVSTALYRYLLNNYYIKKARTEKIMSLSNLDGVRAVYIDTNYIIDEGFLNILSLGPPWWRYKLLLCLCKKALKSGKNSLKFCNRKLDVLFLLDHIEFRYLSNVLMLLATSDIDFGIVDKLYKNTLHGSGETAMVFHDKFYKHLLVAGGDLVKCLISRGLNSMFFLSFIYRVLIEKYRSRDLYDQFQFGSILFHNEYDILQSISYNELKKKGVRVLNFMHGDKALEITDCLAKYDNFLVWGEHYKNHFKKLRYQGGEITVVGNPAYDTIKDYKVCNKELLEIKESYRKVISVYLQPAKVGVCSLRWQTQMVEDVCSYAVKNPDVLVFLKHHPLEVNHPTPKYDEIIGGLKNVKRCNEEYELYDLIAISDLILTAYSTVGLEGILFRKNVLYVNYGGVEDLIPYPSEGSAIEVNNRANFEYYVDDLLNDTIELEPQETIHLHANGIDGMAAQRFYSEIVKCARQKGMIPSISSR